MADKIDLADPDFEPTDEQLGGLMKRAFAEVPDENRRAREAQQQRIEALRVEVLAAVAGSHR